MAKYAVIIALAVLSSGMSYGQNEEDALRYSMTYFGGSARNMSSAGALSAMGGDFGNAGQNPAGLGRLTKSQFSFTPYLEIPSVTSDFNGNEIKSNRVTASFGNLSYVKAYQLDPNKFNNWYSVQIGIGFNRIRSFQDSLAYNGVSDSSILHSFIREANGTPQALIYDYHPFTAGLAYDVYAIDPGATDGEYTTQFQNGNAEHSRWIKRTGGITEFNVITVSGNYANKLLIGGSLNYVRASYSETMKHVEVYNDSTNWLNWTRYTGQLDITGNGLNVRLGAIYMPIPEFRIGVAVETPTAYLMKDFWTNNMRAGTDAGEKFVESQFVPTGSYEYKIRTPFKANMSAALVLKKFGSVGAEIEYVDYTNAKLKSRTITSAPYDFAAENLQIDNIYRPTVNTKIGVEGRITKQLYVRGGFAYYGSPYKASSGNNQNPILFYTGGAGYNFGIMYLDMAYVLQSRKEDYYAYDPTIPGSHATFNVKNSQVVVTVGARF
ncbi:MAG: outer membrane protein transport protein [Crocinitomicaceae bacterium]|nr:outer membrane protein transport protein [Crocinitomicaceae bacterium]